MRIEDCARNGRGPTKLCLWPNIQQILGQRFPECPGPSSPEWLGCQELREHLPEMHDLKKSPPEPPEPELSPLDGRQNRPESVNDDSLSWWPQLRRSGPQSEARHILLEQIVRICFGVGSSGSTHLGPCGTATCVEPTRTTSTQRCSSCVAGIPRFFKGKPQDRLVRASHENQG